MITIATPLSERWYCVAGWLSGLRLLEYDKKKINVVLVSSTKSNIFNDFVLGEVSKYGFKSVKLVNSGLPVIVNREQDLGVYLVLRDRMRHICEVTNACRDEMLKTKCDYGWIIEDDNVIPPDAADKHLKMFAMDKKVGATSAFAIQRFATFGRVPLVWKIVQKQDIFYKQDGSVAYIEKKPKYFCDVLLPPQDEWVSYVGSASFGSVMIKREVLEKIKFIQDYKGLNNHDVAFGGQLMDDDYKHLLDWSMRVKHIHYTGEIV